MEQHETKGRMSHFTPMCLHVSGDTPIKACSIALPLVRSFNNFKDHGRELGLFKSKAVFTGYSADSSLDN